MVGDDERIRIYRSSYHTYFDNTELMLASRFACNKITSVKNQPPRNFQNSHHKMSSRCQKRVSLRFRKRHGHRWMEKELNLLSHLRVIHGWAFPRIQKSFFPSLSKRAVYRAYGRMSVEERDSRASIIPSRHQSASDVNPACSYSRPCRLYTSISVPGTIAQSESTTSTSTTSLLSSEDDTVISNHRIGKRYNLRQNRPTKFPQRSSQCLVDRRRFPHFFKSYKDHLESDGLPDRDYSPPSHTPTPESSDRSPSIVSTQLSDASSLDLFGLEPRPPRLSSLEPSINSDSPIDISSPEFFSSEERPRTP